MPIPTVDRLPLTARGYAAQGRDDRPGHTRAREPHAPTYGAPLGLPLRGLSAAPHFPTAGCGISFALAAPMATTFSIMPKSLRVSHLAVRVT